eukprot:scaffold21704_cov65-Phaeocystis_antarctica.AAC.3
MLAHTEHRPEQALRRAAGTKCRLTVMGDGAPLGRAQVARVRLRRLALLVVLFSCSVEEGHSVQ